MTAFDAAMAKRTMNLYGKNPVRERLTADPSSIRKIFLQDNFNDPEVIKLIKEKNIPCETISEKQINNIKRADRVQGIVAVVDEFNYAPFDDLLTEEKKRTLILLDRINDPHNLGVMIRTAACFGGFAIVIPEYQACGVTDTVLHVASGGDNYVPVVKVNNLARVLDQAKEAGYWIAGAVAGESASIHDFKFSFPLAMVLGSEGEGIRYGIDKHLDFKVHIPMPGAALSFNVNIACAIMCYEVARQRK